MSDNVYESPHGTPEAGDVAGKTDVDVKNGSARDVFAGGSVSLEQSSLRDVKSNGPVHLRQSGAEGAIALNDQGVDGDIVARDNIHGGNIVLDTSRLQPDTCLSFIATLKDGENVAVSSPLSLCISNLPVRTATSNTDKPVVFADGSKAVADAR